MAARATPSGGLTVESLPRRVRLLADGKADAIQDAVSNIMGLQFYAGANTPLVIDRLLMMVPIRYFFSQNAQCDYQIEKINLSIDTWQLMLEQEPPQGYSSLLQYMKERENGGFS